MYSLIVQFLNSYMIYYISQEQENVHDKELIKQFAIMYFVSIFIVIDFVCMSYYHKYIYNYLCKCHCLYGNFIERLCWYDCIRCWCMMLWSLPLLLVNIMIMSACVSSQPKHLEFVLVFHITMLGIYCFGIFAYCLYSWKH